jgi:hypothetical protein
MGKKEANKRTKVARDEKKVLTYLGGGTGSQYLANTKNTACLVNLNFK